MMDIQRVRGAMETITASIAGTKRDTIRWNLAWRDAISKLHVVEVLKSCKEIGYDGDAGEKREAAIVSRLVRRGRAFAQQVDEVEREIRGLYPADKARHRLDTELGWEIRPDDDRATKLDRACMIARARNPDTAKVRFDAHSIIRGRFDDLELKESE